MLLAEPFKDTEVCGPDPLEVSPLRQGGVSASAKRVAATPALVEGASPS